MKKLRAKENPTFDPRSAETLLPGLQYAVEQAIASLNVCRDLLGLPELGLTNGVLKQLPSPATGRKISESIRRKNQADTEAVAESGIRTRGVKPTRKEVRKARQKIARRKFVS